MRIISGLARGTRLVDFEGSTIRPTSDRVRGAIFSMLTSKLGTFEGLRVLDIFAGTGAMGLEALSRGAATALFIDHTRQAQQLLKSNIQRCHLQKNSQLVIQSAQMALATLKDHCFDVIFMDPPYAKNLVPEIILKITEFQLLSRAGIICAEEKKGVDVAARIGSYTRIEVRHYGNTSIHLFMNTAPPLDQEFCHE